MKKKNRVLKSREFQQMISSCHKLANQSFVFYYTEKKETEGRIGISLSRKMGHAVDRNLYKRQVRMMCQELIDFPSAHLDGILIIRFGYRGLCYEDNKKNLEKLLSKAKMK